MQKEKRMKIAQQVASDIQEHNKKAMQREMENVGLTPARLAIKLLEKLDAKETKVHFDPKLGQFQYSMDLEDHTTQLKALELTAKILDLFKDSEVTNTVNVQTLATQHKARIDELDRYLQELLALVDNTDKEKCIDNNDL